MSSFESYIFKVVLQHWWRHRNIIYNTCDGFKNWILSIRNRINVDVIGASWTTDTSGQPEEEKSSDKRRRKQLSRHDHPWCFRICVVVKMCGFEILAMVEEGSLQHISMVNRSAVMRLLRVLR